MTFPNGPLGYRLGMHQPVTDVTLFLKYQENIDFSAVDTFLEDAFGIRIQTEAGSLTLRDESEKLACSLVWRALHIAQALQQAARIPVFETGRIVEILTSSKGPAFKDVRVAVPRNDFIPLQCTNLAHGAALNLAIWVVNNHSDPAQLENIYRQIEEKTIKPMLAMISSGVSTVPILNEAYRQNIPFRHLGAGVYQLGWGSRAQLLDKSSTGADTAIGSKLALNKYLSAQIVRLAGLPAPQHVLVRDEAGADQAAKQLAWPLVVKPVDRDRSEGVTVAVRDWSQLKEAYKNAASFSGQILIEREVPGICYRLLVANGDLLYVLRRKPRSLLGDGRLNIAELIKAAELEERKSPTWLRRNTIGLDTLTLESLARQGLTPQAVPKKGELVELRPIESSTWGGQIEDATTEVHPDNVDIAIRAAKLFGLRIAGIDLISPDISQPWHKNGAIINEVNYSPYLGGNDIAKARLPHFLQCLLGGDGRIPIEVMVGGDDAIKAGRARQQDFIDDGVSCYLTSHDLTIDGNLREMAICTPGLFARSIALLMNRDVEALILVLQTDEFLHSGLPVDRIDKIHLCQGQLENWQQQDSPVTAGDMQSLVELLSIYETGQ